MFFVEKPFLAKLVWNFQTFSYYVLHCCTQVSQKKNRFDSKRISPMHFYNCKILSNTISMTKRGLGWTILLKFHFFFKLENADFHTPKLMTFIEFKTVFLQLLTFRKHKKKLIMINEIKGSPFRVCVCVKICRFFSLIHMQLC